MGFGANIFEDTRPRSAWKPGPRYVAGLDVAQQHDFTALAILERHTTEDFEKEVRLVHLDRWQLPYPDTVAKVGEIFSSEKLAHQAKVVVDATGPGLSFYEDLRRDKTMRDVVRDAGIQPMIITAGQDRSRSGRFFHVSKHYLITRLQTAIRKHQIRVPRKLPLYAVLEQEFEGYELKVREGSNHVTYSNNPRDGRVPISEWCPVSARQPNPKGVL